MFATVASAIVEGVDGHAVTVEVHVSQGLPGYTLVGMPDTSLRESRDRVRAAILSSGFEWPSRRVTINLAPTGLRKHGAALDLPIALGILAASDQLDHQHLVDLGAVGELGLDGSIRKVDGLVCMADAVDRRQVIVPEFGSQAAALVRPGSILTAPGLRSVVDALSGLGPPLESVVATDREPEVAIDADLAAVRGQPMARWSLEVAAAGGHHLLMVGPPGAGKTMLAKAMVGLLPDLEPTMAILATRVHSAAGIDVGGAGLVRRPPLRAPHHGASLVSLIGGGTAALRPGEISCAHAELCYVT